MAALANSKGEVVLQPVQLSSSGTLDSSGQLSSHEHPFAATTYTSVLTLSFWLCQGDLHEVAVTHASILPEE